MKLNKESIVIMLLIVVLTVTAVIVTVNPRVPAGLREGVIATVNGEEIEEEEYNQLLDYYLSELRVSYDLTDDTLNKDMGTGMTLLDSLKLEVLDIIIVNQIIAEKAALNNIGVDEGELEELYEENHLRLMEEDEDYKKMIEDNKIDGDFIKAQMRKNLLGYKYKTFYLDKVEITDETARAFYDENGELFHMEEIKARHILVDEEQLAKDIIKKIDEGEDFAELAMEYSTEPGAQESGGDLGYFSRDVNFVPEFKEAVFALEVGQVSEPVKTEFGYHIITVEDKVEENVEFEEVIEGIKYSLKETDYQNHIGEIFEEADIVKRDEL
ncbi:MAG TPA: peptidylprolyl isomerase [Clostridia bacterium]|nr:peptidylprolyl isomerase [Clostridia bacterium]